MAKQPADRPNSAGVVRELFLPWAADPEPEPVVVAEPAAVDEAAPPDGPAGPPEPEIVLPFGPEVAAVVGLLAVLAAFVCGVVVGLIGQLL